MGADIYLWSIYEPFVEARRARPQQKIDVREIGPEDARRIMEEHYDELRASGGYFRNGYNSGDIMWAIGLSWGVTVGGMLDGDGCLSVENARRLLTMIESRPLTRQTVAEHIFKNIGDGYCGDHPTMGGLRKFLQQSDDVYINPGPTRVDPSEVDTLMAYLTRRRDELMALLRKSIELNEPLRCDL